MTDQPRRPSAHFVRSRRCQPGQRQLDPAVVIDFRQLRDTLSRLESLSGE